MGWPTGFEPATTSSTSLDSTIELRPPTGAQDSFHAREGQGRGEGVKLQAPSSKLQRSTKLQAPIRGGPFWSLVFEVSLELGAWSLELCYWNLELPLALPFP